MGIDDFQSIEEVQKDVKVSQIEINCGISTKYGKQLFPEKNAHDGFYYARLIKV